VQRSTLPAGQHRIKVTVASLLWPDWMARVLGSLGASAGCRAYRPSN